MKRISIVILVALVSLTLLSASAFAEGSAKAIGVVQPKKAGFVVTVVLDGPVLRLTATTPKHGSAIKDDWTGVDEGSESTVLTDDGYYVSTATFTLRRGVHEVSYEIIMSAGSSGVTWEEKRTGTITVTPEPTGGGGESGWPAF